MNRSRGKMKAISHTNTCPSQTLCTSVNTGVVTRAAPKPWSIICDFALTLSMTIVWIHLPHKKATTTRQLKLEDRPVLYRLSRLLGPFATLSLLFTHHVVPSCLLSICYTLPSHAYCCLHRHITG